ncbi:transglycosylase SLT domain-containing protein [Siccirubricoccus phaeus]|uniref:transglycosylase SLT domain-containing protein n=1 Tax=Siccirubricoccus phaeus TaxID=2595053 RepID=UPI00165AB911|nr:transglycosylase SLT domain-containing protein [Siccirubricoccus phaeus]
MAQDWGLCRQAIAAAEPASGLPRGLLLAIAMVETGRHDPATGRIAPWPWSWNAGGEPGFAPSRAAAEAELRALLEAGRRSVDVGCMQVNLLHHPDAFPRPEDGFDPARNVAYAIRFLKELYARTGNWGSAIAQYHSSEDARGAAYQSRVAMARLAAAWGQGGSVPLRAARGLCAAGRQPVLVFRRGAPRPHLACEVRRRPDSARAPG